MSTHTKNLLYYSRSGNSLRAAIAVEMAEEKIEKCFVDLAQQEQKSDRHLALNPAGTVPVYVEESGEKQLLVITQSGAIAEYLLLHTRPDLFPTTSHELAIVRSSCYAAISDIAIQNSLMRYMAFSDKNVSFLQARFLYSLDVAFEKVKSGSYVCGNDMTIADIFHYPAVHLRRPMLSMQKGFGHILNWADRMKKHDQVINAIAYAGVELPHE